MNDPEQPKEHIGPDDLILVGRAVVAVAVGAAITGVLRTKDFILKPFHHPPDH